jgi:hypothetical protein
MIEAQMWITHVFPYAVYIYTNTYHTDIYYTHMSIYLLIIESVFLFKWDDKQFAEMQWPFYLENMFKIYTITKLTHPIYLWI